jgi:hypothetical protein
MVDEEYYCAGSDDFRGYLWKLPRTSELKERRKQFALKEWEDFPLPSDPIIGASIPHY